MSRLINKPSRKQRASVNMWRRIGKIIIALCLVWGIMVLSGCALVNVDLTKEKETSVGNNNSEAKITLNERQKEILAEMGLATEYEALTRTQKKVIVAIEEMLQAVEQKYGMEFAYAGYAAKGPLEPERLWAFPVGGNQETETFIVTRKTVDGEVVYEDTHLLIAAAEMFSLYVETELKGMTGIEEIKVYSQLTELTTDSVPDSYAAFDGCTAAEILIFFDSASCSAEQLQGIISNFESWMREHHLYGAVQYILLNEKVLPALTSYNYMDYLAGDYYQAREFSYLNR